MLNDAIQLIGPASLVGNSRETFHKSGTEGSNPVPSSAESASNRSNGVRGQMSANYRLASRPTLTTDLMVENRRKHDQTARICIVIGLSAARAARTARSPASLLRP